MDRKFSLATFVMMMSAAVMLGGCTVGGTTTMQATKQFGNTTTAQPVAATPNTGTNQTGATNQSTTATPGTNTTPGTTTTVVPNTPLPPSSMTQIELILDDSGSMADLIGGQAKIAIAKDSMNKIIDNLKTKDSLQTALRIYGHQNKLCTDSVVEIPMGPIDAAAMKAKIKDLKPLGYTPIAYSLTESVKDFKKDISGQKIVVLVTDGLESCNGDPCAAAKALKAGGIINQIDVVGFGLTKTELNTLKCITDPSGGQVLGASNATEFMGAMQSILKKTLQYNLDLYGKTTKGEAVAMDVKVSQGGKLITEEQGDNVQMLLPAGSYDIQANSTEGLGSATLTGVVVTTDQITKKDIVFSQSGLTISVVGADSKPLQASDICAYITGQTTNPVSCAGFYTDTFAFKMKPGTYDIEVKNAGVTPETWLKGIVLNEGDMLKRTVSFAQGTIKVSTIGADGQPLQAGDICLYPQGQTANSLQCAGFATADFDFTVAPGTYDLKVTNGETSEDTWVKSITLGASQTVSKTVTLLEGVLSVTVTDSSGQATQASDICIYAPGTTDNSLKCAGFYTSDFDFKVKPGTYDLKVISSTDTSQAKWVKGITIKASETVTKNVSL